MKVRKYLLMDLYLDSVVSMFCKVPVFVPVWNVKMSHMVSFQKYMIIHRVEIKI